MFVTTHWSVVLAAAGDSARAEGALASLCQTYWYPLYVYVRRRGYSPHDAQDLTQEFFARLLERQSLGRADPSRGRFRSFMLSSLNHFLSKEWEKAQTQKRGGGRQVVSLDFAAGERRYDLELADHATPDKAFDKQWALALLDQVLERLDHEYQEDGKGDLFAALKRSLAGTRESQPYAELATQLGVNESTVKVAVHRLRKRYRELLNLEIANTVNSPGEAEAELRQLLQALAGT